MPKIVVLKSFVFTPKPVASEAGRSAPLPQELRFTPGEHEVSDEVFNHPWLSVYHADGKIEAPAETLARLKREAEVSQARADEAALATKRSEEAWARTLSQQTGVTASAEEIAAELNTPVSQLASRQVASGNAALTPSNELRAAASKPDPAREPSPVSTLSLKGKRA